MLHDQICIMQFSVLRMLADGLFLMDSQYADGYLPLVNKYLKGEINTENFESFKTESYLIYDKGARASHVGDVPSNKKSVAVAHLKGPIMKYGTMCQDGTMDHAAFLENCYAASNIAGVVFEVDSPGGAVDAIDVLTEALQQRNKPVLFHVNGMMGSAAYWLASHGDEIHSNYKNSDIGSIGAMASLRNLDGALEKMGVKTVRLHSKYSPKKNAAAREFLEEGKTTLIQNQIDAIAKQFIEVVSENRGIEEDHEVMEGGVFNTEEALSFGLIDGKLTLAATIERCMELSEGYEAPKSKESQNDIDMFGKKNNSFKALAAFAETSAEERTKEQLEAVNAELQEAGIDAVLAEANLEATLNGKIESLSAKVTTLESAKTDVEGKLKAEKEAKEAAEASLGKVKAVFGEDAEAEDFDLEASVTTLKEEREKFAKLVPGGAEAKKKEGDDMGDGDEELSEAEQKVRSELDQY